jgi:acyl-CoA synthetase (AMP-forming)/AMP-acid ligase II
MIAANPQQGPSVPEVSLPQFVLEGAAARGDRPALIDSADGGTLTYSELARSVERVAARLSARGLAKGDVFAIWCPNGIEFVVAYYGALTAGAIVTTINPLLTAHEAAHQLGQAKARWLLTTEELFAEKAGSAAADAGVEHVVTVGVAEGAESFAALIENSDPLPSAVVGPDDTAILPFSSGTTGLPKGVVLTHRNLIASLCATRTVHRVGADDVLVGVLPLFHIYGMQVTLNLGLLAGATIVTMPRFELGAFLRLIQHYRVTRADLVPPIVLALAKSPAVDEHDLSSLRLITTAAAPLGTDLARACAARLQCRVKQAYGMTELGGGTHFAPDEGRDEPGSIGPALPGVECRVVDCTTGAEVRPGELGELLLRTPAAMRGYLDNPLATAATVDADGWVHTGDVVSVDRRGWFTVVDRVKELIKYNGYQVPPAELEAVLVTHPAVADVAVIAGESEEGAEVPKAFVVPRSPVTAEELMQFVADRVAAYKKVRLVEFVNAIPKSPSGKILRRVLVEGDRARSAQEAA